MLFWKRQNENASKDINNSDVYGAILRRFAELATDIELCKTQIKVLQTDVDNLRGNFNRKLKGLEQETKTETKDINTSEFIGIG
jgi:hypothetical protein